MNLLLWPFGQFYQLLVRVKNFAYENKWFKVYKIAVPVVSIGNITTGGTGKTPVIAALLEWSIDSRISAGVVSRGYKGQFKGVQKVDPTQHWGATFYGDEPFMLAHRFSANPVYVCPDRVVACESLLKAENVDVIFADDAFQHRRLGRDIDVVILDAMEKLENYLPLPVGRGREPIVSLRRAQFIIINKVNLASTESVVQLLKSLEEFFKNEGWPLPTLIEANYTIDSIANIHNLNTVWMKQHSTIAISGIARPCSFEKLLKNQDIKILKHFKFKDHHSYSESDIAEIVRYMDKNKAVNILTTEKDIEKLSGFSVLVGRIWVVKLKLEFSSNVVELYEDIRRIIL